MGDVYKSKYRILKVLKETPEVSVFLAEHIFLNSYWIIKKINKKMSLRNKEIEVLKQLRHPGIPLITDIFDDGDEQIIVREYMPGKTLEEYFHEKVRVNGFSTGLHENEVIEIGLKLCDILIFLHETVEQPIIHRDIKPANIIISPDGQLSLIDFGIARFHEPDRDKDTEYLGTRGFASPEQYGLTQSDVRTDVFGVGATLYYLAVNEDLSKPPYRVSPITDKRKDYSRDFERLLLTGCSIAKEQRYNSMRELKSSLTSLPANKSFRISDKSNAWALPAIIVDHFNIGDGASYLVMLMAKHILNLGKKPLVIDTTGDLSRLEYQPESRIVDGMVIFDEIPIFHLTKKEKNFPELSAYDCLIFDEKPSIDDISIKSENGYELTVTSISPWSLDVFEEKLLSPSFQSHLIVVNHCSNHAFQQLSRSLPEVLMLHLPFCPYEEVTENESTIFEILKGWEVYRKWLEEENYITPPLSRIKNLFLRTN